MSKSEWTLQDAKARFSAVVDAALKGEAQTVTRRGKKAVVVLAATDYERFLRGERAGAPDFIAHLLSIPKETPAERRRNSEPRPTLRPRDVGFR